MATVELRFRALPSHVRTARLAAASLGRRLGVDEALLDEIKLAVGEACSRAVSVHQAHHLDELVLVRLCDDDDVYTVEVLDAGPTDADLPPSHGSGRASARDLLDSPGLASPQADAPGQLPSGLGLALIEGLVDDVTITPRTAATNGAENGAGAGGTTSGATGGAGSSGGPSAASGTVVRMNWPLLPE